MNAVCATVDVAAAERFSSGSRIALIGTPDNPKISRRQYSTNLLLMATTWCQSNPACDTVAGRSCCARLGDVPMTLDGAIRFHRVHRTVHHLRWDLAVAGASDGG